MINRKGKTTGATAFRPLHVCVKRHVKYGWKGLHQQQTANNIEWPQCAGNLLSVLPGMCGAAARNIWMTLMKGEKWNNQRSLPFSLDRCVHRQGLAAHRSACLWSDIKIQYISLSISLILLFYSLSAPCNSPHPPLSMKPTHRTAAKG